MQRSDSSTGERHPGRLTGPLSPVEVRRARALALVYPVVAALAVLLLGVSAARLVLVTVFFAAWVGIQLLVLSPDRRRQVLGLPVAEAGLD